MAATKAGNAVLEINSDLLIFIEGLDYANDMLPIKTDPIHLDVPNRLVYSFHYYDWQYLTSTLTYSLFKKGLEKNATFMLEEGHDYTAPVWLGEFGTNSDSKYWKYLILYLKETPDVHWAYWAYNGYQESEEDEESFGLVMTDFDTPRDPWKLEAL
jgi:endoglucanase